MSRLPLILFHIIAFAAVLFGRTYNEPNRDAGLISVCISLGLCLVVTSVRERRALIATVITLAGLAAVALAYSAIDPASIDTAGSKGWQARAIADRWPHFDRVAVSSFLAQFSLVPLRIEPNVVGFLAMGLPLSALAAVTASRRPWKRYLWLLVAAAGGLLVAGSGSRASTAGILAGFAVLVSVAATPHPRGRLIVGLSVYVGALLAGIDYWSADPNLSGRVGIVWRPALAARGAGSLLGSYGALANEPGNPINAHNVALQTLLDFGWLGLAAFAAAIAWSLAAAARLLRHPGTPMSGSVGDRMGLLTLSFLAALSVTGNLESMLTAPLHFEAGFVTILIPVIPVVLAAPLGLDGGASRSDAGSRRLRDPRARAHEGR